MKETIIDIEQLSQDAHNFNRGTEEGRELMQRSLQQLGAGRSILIDKDNNIIAGNKTQEAARKAGIRRVRIIETSGDELVAVKRTDIDIDSAKGRELALVDNLATQINLQWDEAQLETITGEVEGFDPDSWGWEPPTFEGEGNADGEGQGEQPEAKEDDFDPDEVHETKVKRGDVWQLGEHRLMCGDSTNADDVATLMNGERADCVFTDPPYGYKYQSNKPRNGGKNYDMIMNDDKILDFFPNVVAHCSGWIFICTTWKVLDIWMPLFKKYLDITNMVVWNKGGGGMGDLKKTFYTDHEIILTANQGNEFYGNRIGSVWKFQADMPSSYLHPTQKPVALSGCAIQKTTKETDIVLDLFGGSGSTLIACEQLDRKARLMELDPHYCDVIIARWEKLTGGKAIRL